MKKSLSFFGLLCVLFVACDRIAEDERLIYVEPIQIPSDLDSTGGKKVVPLHVLIEDFTGQRCVNCPDASDEIHSLQQAYGEDQVIAVGIHGGPMSVKPNPSRPNVIGLATETGDNYNNYWKVDLWPMGMVNRSGLLAYTEWNGRVRQELQKTAPVDITARFSLLGDGKARVDAKVEGVDGHAEGKLQVWIVEDNITATQLMPDGSANASYVHQHVFRQAVNGEWGVDVSVDEGQEVDFCYDVSVADDWNASNLSAVVFLYSDNGVLQVTSCSVRQSE